jgi:hypothetical protein
MKVDSTHFHGFLLCPLEKKFFHFVTLHRSVAHSRQCTDIEHEFPDEIEKIAAFTPDLREKDA